MPIARTTSKWQIQLPLVAPSPFWGGAARRAAGGMIMPPNGVQGQRPWHAFGDFRRETKVTRGAGRSARISWAAGAHAPAPALPGERSTPFTYTPKSPKSCIPTCNRTERKIKKEEALPEPMGRASLHVASDDTSACSVKRNMRSGKNNCPAALENCWKICYNY